MEQRLAGSLEDPAGGRRFRVRAIARFEEPLRREDRVRPGGASKLFRGSLGDARRLLGGRERGFEPPLLESPPGLDEQILDAVEVTRGIASQDEARVPLRGGLGLQLHEDLGRVRCAREGLHEIPFLLETVEADPMPLSEIPKLPRPKPPQPIFHPPPIGLAHDGDGIWQGHERLNQQPASRLAPPLDSMGPREVTQDVGGQVGERLLQCARRGRTSGNPSVRGAINIPAPQSGVWRPIPAQHLDRPLDLPELVGVAARVGMMLLRLDTVGFLDRRGRGPTTTESGRMDPNVLEPENAKRGRNPFRLEIELPQVGEDPAGLMAAFDAVPLVVPRDVAPDPVVAAAGEAEEPIRHAIPSTDGGWVFRVGVGKGYFQPPCSRHPCRSAPVLPCSRTKGNCPSTSFRTRWSTGRSRLSGSSACSGPSWRREPRATPSCTAPWAPGRRTPRSGSASTSGSTPPSRVARSIGTS